MPYGRGEFPAAGEFSPFHRATRPSGPETPAISGLPSGHDLCSWNDLIMLASITDLYTQVRDKAPFALALRPKVVANYRHFQQELGARPLVMRSSPPSVEIELTNRCNLACVQCLRSRGLKPYELGQLGFDDYRKILAQFPYVMHLCLNGFGEPMMHDRFFDVVDYTRRERPWCRIGIYSNGMLIDDDKAARLVESGVADVNISIDAATAATYHKVRRGGKLEVVHENVRRLMRARQRRRARLPRVGLNFVMLNENEGELVPFVEQAADLGVDFINCISYASYDWGFRNRRTPVSYKRELEAAAARMTALGVRCKSFPSPDLSWTDPKHAFDCSFFWGQNLRVAFSGDVMLGCCSPFKESYSYGNVLAQPFSEIWNNEKFQRNRMMALHAEPPNAICASCDAFCKSFFTPRTDSRYVKMQPVG
jgi:MoaA/NifB/PqqE/SkfB family radical SAM enzyme